MTVKTERVVFEFMTEVGRKYILDWSNTAFPDSQGLYKLRLWVEVDRPTFGYLPRGKTIAEVSVMVPGYGG